jgi:hypothetical protein
VSNDDPWVVMKTSEVLVVVNVKRASGALPPPQVPA